MTGRNDVDGDLQDMQPATPETVQVPIELLKRAFDNMYQGMPVRDEIGALIPAPKPRLVAVDLNRLSTHTIEGGAQGYLDALPDLFATLDAVIDVLIEEPVASTLKPRIRAAFGVTS